MNFLIEGKTPEKAREELTRVLTLQGWERAPGASAGEGNIIFKQGGIWCIIRTSAYAGGSQEPSGASVTIMVTDRLPEQLK